MLVVRIRAAIAVLTIPPVVRVDMPVCDNINSSDQCVKASISEDDLEKLSFLK